MNEKFLKPYDPQATEDTIYQKWEKSGFFNPDNLPGDRTEPFTIVLPPPNVTGVLHLGHAYEDTLQDAVIRFQRMRGKKALWIPGTDSAAIATQARVEKNIQKEEGKSRHDLGREELVKRVEAFAKSSENTILNQVRKMGASLDWSRYAYTLDDTRYKAVMTAFVNMYNAGLIYRGDRIVNWDPKGQTTISDDEIQYEERKAVLYTFKYSKDFPIAISTTRPETKIGDTAVAVNPDDERYKEFVGKEYDFEFCGVPVHVKIIADKEVDKEFGTGALGVTPAHSHIDWAIADRHNLPRKQVINEYAKMMVGDERILNKKTTEARAAIVEWLKQENLLIEEKEITQNISVAERTGGIVEPLPKLQWWVAVNKAFTLSHSEIDGIASGSVTTLKEIMRKAVESGAVQMPQERFSKSYFHWIDNLHDWCISRQIWFGHRIPVWYKRQLGGPHQAKHFQLNSLLQKLEMTEQEFRRKTFEWEFYDHAGGGTNIQIGAAGLKQLKEKGLIDNEWIKNNEIPQAVYRPEEIHVGIEPPVGPGWHQEEDVLDTWFSSALWTFSTLGWPDTIETSSGKAKPGTDLAMYHPTSFMSPAYEILNLWVSRMIMMSGFHLGQVPFKTVMIHGIVRDKQGRKFSKSLGNGIDPLDMIAKYGADALRMGLIVGTAIGNDIQFDESKVKGYKNFANKLWNITRFILSYQKENDIEVEINDQDKALIENLNTIIADVTKDIEEYRLYMATEKLYHYIWHELADIILEDSKPIFAGDDEQAKASRRKTLIIILETCLKALHPFMPFVTEEIWGLLGHKQLLMVEQWPQ